MIVSFNWLQRFFERPLESPEVVAETLTLAGLEVDQVKPALADFSGVIVAEIQEVYQHPSADRLNVCKVFDGNSVVDVVCGGVNVRAGLKIAFATVGAVLPGDFRIKKAKLRGVESNGMICAAEELGLPPDPGAHVIMELAQDAPVGNDFRQYYGDDTLLEVDLTPNRGDCASMLGMARELAAIKQWSFNPVVCEAQADSSSKTIDVSVEDAACPRYFARVLTNINREAVTPLWLRLCIERAGIRSIHPVVDVLNYVMLELGQPMHGFDLAKLAGKVTVRAAKAGESLKLLDGNVIELSGDDKVIADQNGPLALAGIMGGLDSSVTELTDSVLLESAFFEPSAIAVGQRRYHLHTDSAYRYARGVDPALAEQALQRASELLLTIVGGELGPVIQAANTAVAPLQVNLPKTLPTQLLGYAFSDEQVVTLLQNAGFTIASQADHWQVTVPSYRFDITQAVDLVEEVARLYGYQNIPAAPMPAPTRLLPVSESVVKPIRIKQLLSDRGYCETVSYSFVDAKLQQQLAPEAKVVSLINPIAKERAVMRTQLWPGLLEAAQHNLRRRQLDFKLFEIAHVYHVQDDQSIKEPTHLAGLVTGKLLPTQWNGHNPAAGFFQVKQDVEAVLALNRRGGWQWRVESHSVLHPGQSAALYHQDQLVGYLGALHPALQQELGLDQSVVLFEFDMSYLTHSRVPYFEPVSKFPTVRRDLALLVDRSVSVGDMQAHLLATLGENLHKVEIFDVYQGDKLEKNQKSIGFSLIFSSSSHTLIEEEVSRLSEQALAALTDRFQATLREG